MAETSQHHVGSLTGQPDERGRGGPLAVALASSAGGLEAMKTILSGLPSDLPT